MAADFRRVSPVARRAFEEADDALGFSLSRIIDEGPEEALRQTPITQPAILTASVAMLRVLREGLSAPPGRLAGHSLGEYTALVAAGALEFADAVRIVHQRGTFMQEAVPVGVGSMVAVLGLPGDRVGEICAGVEGAVAPANFNAPEQTVIAGEVEAVQRASEALEADGARRLVPLDVSAPFHCALMEPALERMRPVLAQAELRSAEVPVVSNVTAEPYHGGDEARDLLARQICAPVQWVRSVERLVADGCRLHVEVGPGRVLTGLAARIDRKLARQSLCALDALEAVHKAISEL